MKNCKHHPFDRDHDEWDNIICTICGSIIEIAEDEEKYDDDQEFESELENFNCVCGAYTITNKGIIQISDCICGSSVTPIKIS